MGFLEGIDINILSAKAHNSLNEELVFANTEKDHERHDLSFLLAPYG